MQFSLSVSMAELHGNTRVLEAFHLWLRWKSLR